MFAPFLAGQDLTASLLTTGVDNAYQVKGVTIDLTVASTTFQTASELSTTLVTTASYIVQCQFVFDAATADDIQIRFTTPVGTIIRLAPWGQNTTTNDTVPQQATDSTTTATINYGGRGAGTFCLVRPCGALISVSGAGTLDIAFARVSASGGSVLLKVGSMVALSRIF